MQAVVDGGQRLQHTRQVWIGFDIVQHIVGCKFSLYRTRISLLTELVGCLVYSVWVICDHKVVITVCSNVLHTSMPRHWAHGALNGCGLCAVQVTGKNRQAVWCSRSQKCPAKRKRSSLIKGSQTALLAEMSVFAENQQQTVQQRRAQRRKCPRNGAISMPCGL